MGFWSRVVLMKQIKESAFHFRLTLFHILFKVKIEVFRIELEWMTSVISGSRAATKAHLTHVMTK